MTPFFLSRTAMMFGDEAIARLQAASVAVFGIGGVGGYCAEALARSGIGRLAFVDDDKICVTNINRQIVADQSTIGKYKVDLMRQRALAINPDIEIEVYREFFLPENAGLINFEEYDYVVDAVDTVTAKLEIVRRCAAAGVRVISCMGAANKLDPSKFIVTDVFQTANDPLAKVMRRELKKAGINSLKVVCSTEKPIKMPEKTCACYGNCVCPPGTVRRCSKRRQIPASNAFVPPVAGLIAAGEVVKELARVL